VSDKTPSWAIKIKKYDADAWFLKFKIVIGKKQYIAYTTQSFPYDTLETKLRFFLDNMEGVALIHEYGTVDVQFDCGVIVTTLFSLLSVGDIMCPKPTFLGALHDIIHVHKATPLVDATEYHMREYAWESPQLYQHGNL
jgi:hypothetical protein